MPGEGLFAKGLGAVSGYAGRAWAASPGLRKASLSAGAGALAGGAYGMMSDRESLGGGMVKGAGLGLLAAGGHSLYKAYRGGPASKMAASAPVAQVAKSGEAYNPITTGVGAALEAHGAEIDRVLSTQKATLPSFDQRLENARAGMDAIKDLQRSVKLTPQEELAGSKFGRNYKGPQRSSGPVGPAEEYMPGSRSLRS